MVVCTTVTNVLPRVNWLALKLLWQWQTQPFIPKKRYRAFTMPRKIAYDDHLTNLSHDSLRMYIYLAHKTYRRPLESSVVLFDWEAAKHLGISAEAVPLARQQLKNAKLIDFRMRSKYAVEYLIVHDVSLHESVSGFADLPK
jgi:hypothetical protein